MPILGERFYQMSNTIFCYDLKPIPLAVYSYLVCCAGQKDVCWPSMKTIALHCGCSENAARDAVSLLVERGFRETTTITSCRCLSFPPQTTAHEGEHPQQTVGKCMNKTKSNKKKYSRQVIAPESENWTRYAPPALFAPVGRCVRFFWEQREKIPAKAERADLGQLRRSP